VVRLARDGSRPARRDVPQHAQLGPQSPQEVEEVRTALFGSLAAGLHSTNDATMVGRSTTIGKPNAARVRIAGPD